MLIGAGAGAAGGWVGADFDSREGCGLGSATLVTGLVVIWFLRGICLLGCGLGSASLVDDVVVLFFACVYFYKCMDVCCMGAW